MKTVRIKRSAQTKAVFFVFSLAAAILFASFHTAHAGWRSLNYTSLTADDYSVFNTSSGWWHMKSRNGATVYSIPWGWNEAHPVPGDYTGNGRGDLAVYHRETGTWFIRTLGGQQLAWALPWGHKGAHAVGAGDYNRDGKTDLAVFDPQLGKWYIRALSGKTLAWGVDWGWAQAQIVPGDYNGDGKTDIGIYDRLTGKWYILSLDGRILAWAVSWGWNEARPVPGDFNGDGKADLAVYHKPTGTWFIRTLSGKILAWAEPWGWNGARPVPMDFNGNKRSDLAVYYEPTGQWFVRSLTGQTLTWGTVWGGNERVPLGLYGSGCEGYVVVSVGDSITYGRGSSTHGPETSYPTFLDRRLGTALGGFSYVVNAGIPGDTTVSGRERFPGLITQFKPSLTILMEGVNDLFAEDKGNQIIDNLTWMAQHARSRKVSMVMATLPPLVNRSFKDRTDQHQRVRNTNPRIRDLAPQMGWPLGETYNTITSVSNWENKLFNEDQTIHPNDDAYRIYRDEFIRAIRRGINQGLFVY